MCDHTLKNIPQNYVPVVSYFEEFGIGFGCKWRKPKHTRLVCGFGEN
jgi:hypothetical protein